MKKTLLLFVSMLILSGCGSTPTPVKKYSATNSNIETSQVCNFNSIESNEYALTSDPFDLIKSRVYFSRDLSFDYRKDLEKRQKMYDSLKNGFKFTGTVETCNSEAIRCSSMKIKENIKLIEGELLVVKDDDKRMFEVVNQQCELAYILAGITYEPENNFVRKDGAPLEIKDYSIMHGDSYFNELEMKAADVEEDKFNNTVTISSITIHDLDTSLVFYENNRRMFRAFGNLKTKKLLVGSIQLQIELGFNGWAMIEGAYDEDTNYYKALKINSDPKCSSSGCVNYETIGIDFPLSYLETKKDTGFEIKFSGKQDRVVMVPKYLIRQILDGVASYAVN